jgi:cation diffusion facilitator family transporter
MKLIPINLLRTSCIIKTSCLRSFSSHRPDPVVAQESAKAATRLGAVFNVGLGIIKGAAGYMVGSTGLISDSANSFSDIITDSVVYYALTASRTGASIDNPWGSGKIESIGTLAVGGMLLTTGALLGYSGLSTAVEIGSTHTSFCVDEGWSAHMGAAIIVAGGSAAAKEYLFHKNLKAGQDANSSVVIANAWQHRSDAFASCAVLCGLVGSASGYPLFDPLAGVLVAGIIANQGRNSILEAFRDLRDSPATKEETDKLREACLTVPGIKEVHKLHARMSGPYIFVETTLGVPGNISASAAHRMATHVKQLLLKDFPDRVAGVTVHVNPIGASGLGQSLPDWAREYGAIEERAKEAVLTVDGIIGVTEVQVYFRDDGSIGIKVDVVMKPEMTVKTAHEISKLARKAVEKVFPGESEHHIDIDMELHSD